jgi:anti-sigma-K factor RskA
MESENHVVDLLPAYALDCLDEEESLVVIEHLATCSLCRAELETYQTVSDSLALAAPDAVPSSGLKSSLMNRIQTVSKPSQNEKVSLWERLNTYLRQFSPIWSLASLSLVILLAISNLFLWQQVNQGQLASRNTIMRVIPLTATSQAPGASGLIVISTNGEYGTLVVDHLPDLDQGRQYQLWLIQDNTRTSGGVFSVSPDGYGGLSVQSPKPLSSYSAFGVTIEPRGGSSAPTGEKVLGGNM